MRVINSEVYINSGIYLERLPNISFYQTTRQVLFKFSQPKSLIEKSKCNQFCIDHKKLCEFLQFSKDYFSHVNTNLENRQINDNERILADDGEIFDFQYATRNHVKRMFTNNYEIAVLMKRVMNRGDIVIHEGQYQTNLDNYIKNISCNEKNFFELVMLDYNQRYDWTRSFVNMCQNKKLQLDIVTMDILSNVLDLVKINISKDDYVIALTTVSQYYSMPLIECIISQDVAIIGIHIPILKKELKDLVMKKVVTPTFAWNEYTCSVNIPSFTVALVQRNSEWTILVPKCDPFKEELCLVSEAHNTETIALLCVRQVLTGGTMKQFMSVCPINCRETGKQNQFITPIGSHKFLVTHPKENLTLQCPEKHHNLTINPNIGSLWVDIPCYCYFKDNSLKNIYPTYPCVDKTITYSTRQVIPAVWSKFPGLTLPSWETTMPQFDNLNSCLNEAWIENHQDEVSTPKITYFVIMNFILIIVVSCTYTYLYVQLRHKFLYYTPYKVNPSDKKSFNIKKVKFSNPVVTFTKLHERPLPETPIQEEENEYLSPDEINLPSTSTTTSSQCTTPIRSTSAREDTNAPSSSKDTSHYVNMNQVRKFKK
ncbi:hypothetical protein RN001_001321 [Aquatica leii]|uniref:Uncharacterized protein n=1 Tax=Aquatica leii TaxID=1421715 RepID=A0AAN7QAA6_9COLE|nr:hypothetical protein RN001_001321 [Aquatica leii]